MLYSDSQMFAINSFLFFKKHPQDICLRISVLTCLGINHKACKQVGNHLCILYLSPVTYFIQGCVCVVKKNLSAGSLLNPAGSFRLCTFKTSNNQRLRSVFDVTRLSLLCQVGGGIIRPCIIYGGCQIRRPKIHSFNQRCPIQSQLQSVLYVHVGVCSFYMYVQCMYP